MISTLSSGWDLAFGIYGATWLMWRFAPIAWRVVLALGRLARPVKTGPGLPVARVLRLARPCPTPGGQTCASGPATHSPKAGQKAPWWARLSCRLGHCRRCETVTTTDGIGGRCVSCGKVHGWMAWTEFQRFMP